MTCARARGCAGGLGHGLVALVGLGHFAFKRKGLVHQPA